MGRFGLIFFLCFCRVKSNDHRIGKRPVHYVPGCLGGGTYKIGLGVFGMVQEFFEGGFKSFSVLGIVGILQPEKYGMYKIGIKVIHVFLFLTVSSGGQDYK